VHLPDKLVLSPACGLLKGRFGEEILIASTRFSYILNLNDLTWRSGPPLPDPNGSLTYAQVSGGFVAIGGSQSDDHHLQI